LGEGFRERQKKIGEITYFFVVPKILFTFDPTNQIFLPLKGCLVFIKKGEEIRLCETLATNPSAGGERCQNLIPESREMIKI
jgi:hypothetical protein